MKKWTWASMVALAFALLAATAPAASAGTVAPLATNSIRNTGTVGIGAIMAFDGVYKHGTVAAGNYYDDVIPGGRFSGYAYTSGMYIGPGYCVRVRGWLNSSGTDLGPVAVRLPGHYEFNPAYVGFDIRALSLSNSLCAGATSSATDDAVLLRT